VASAPHPFSPPVGEMPGRAEGGERAPTLLNWSPYPRHSSTFTRAFPPRGLTMHVSRSPCFRMRDRPGHGIVPRYVTGCGPVVKTRSRAPFGGFSRATPVPLRHRMHWERGRLFSLHARDVRPAIHRWHVGLAGPSPPAWHPMPPMPHRHARPFFRPEEDHFLRRAPAWSFASSPHARHRSRLAASPCGVAEAGRKDCLTGFWGVEKWV
jgi:hypothetical protein